MNAKTQDIAIQEQAGTYVAQASQSANIVAMVLEASRDPAIDAAKVQTMADLAMRLQDREQLQQFNADKVAAIIEMPTIRKDGAIIIPGKDGQAGRVQGHYAKYENLQAVVDPILAKHNLVITHNLGSQGPMPTVTPILSHRNGYVEKGEPFALPLETSGSKNNTQGAGSSASYGKRYTTCAMLNIRVAGEDDDGMAAGGSREKNLQPFQVQLIKEANAAAKNGGGAYLSWFKGRDAAEKGWLVFEGYHQELKLASGAE